jgi:hypothetical protein
MLDPIASPKSELRLSTKQERILATLRGDVPEIARMYEAGLRLIADDSFPARVYLVGHAMREIMNRLPDHYDIPMPSQVPYHNVIAGVSSKWKASVRPAIEVAASAPMAQLPVYSVPAEIVVELDRLIREHDESAGMKRDARIRLLASHDVPGAAPAYPEPVIKQWSESRGVEFAHMRAARASPPSFPECLSEWTKMEEMLHAILAPRHESFKEIDDVLKDANT